MPSGHVIHFTVMDHDLVWTNDFEGEAFLELSSLPGLRGDLGEGGYKDLKYTELFLVRPKSKNLKKNFSSKVRFLNVSNKRLSEQNH